MSGRRRSTPSQTMFIHQPACITDCATPSSRQLRQSHRDDDVGEELASDAAQRFIFATVRVGATGSSFFLSEFVRCRRSVPLRDLRLHFTIDTEANGRAQQTRDTRPSCNASTSKQLAFAQQYLQALREDISTPHSKKVPPICRGANRF